MKLATGRSSAVEVDLHVARRIRHRRVKRGINQREFGKLIGVSYRQAYKYEHGLNRVSVGLLYLISEVLDVPIDYFFQGIHRKQPSSRTLLLETTTHFALIQNRKHQDSFSELVRVLAEQQS